MIETSGRSGRRLILFGVPACLILLTLVYFGRGFFGRQVMGAADILYRESPWNTLDRARDVPIQNHYLADTGKVNLPFRMYFWDRMGRGDFPLWCPEVGGGYPTFAGRYGLYHPLNLLSFLPDFTTAHTLFYALELLCAGLFMYLLMHRTYACPPAVSCFAAVATMFSFPLTATMLYELNTMILVFLPLILMFYIDYERSGRIRSVVFAGGCAGVAILSSSIQGFLQLGCFLAIYGGVAVFLREPGTSLAAALKVQARGLGLLMGIGMLMGAPMLIPSLEFLLFYSERVLTPGWSSWIEHLPFRLALLPLLPIGILFPDWLGSHEGLDVVKMFGDPGPGDFAGPNVKIYAGVLAGVLAFWICRRKRHDLRIRRLMCLTVGIVGVVLLTPLGLWVYGRFFAFAVFPLTVLAALAVREIAHHAPGDFLRFLRKAVALWAVCLLVGNIVLAVFHDDLRDAGRAMVQDNVYRASVHPEDHAWQFQKVDHMLDHYRLNAPPMWVPGAILLLGMAALMLYDRFKFRSTLIPVMFCCLAFTDLAYQGYRYHPYIDRRDAYPPLDSMAFLRQREQGAPYRATSVWESGQKPVFDPNTLMPYGVSDMRCYLGTRPMLGFLLQPNFAALCGIKYVIADRSATVLDSGLRLIYDREVKIYENIQALPRAYLAAGYREVPSTEEMMRIMKQEGFDGSFPVIVTSGPPSARSGAAIQEVRVARYEPESVRLEVRADRPGYVILSDRYYPGWSARVDGIERPIRLANYAFRAVYVEPGDHVIEFSFLPMSWVIGLCLCGAAVLGMGVMILRKPR